MHTLHKIDLIRLQVLKIGYLMQWRWQISKVVTVRSHEMRREVYTTIQTFNRLSGFSSLIPSGTAHRYRIYFYYYPAFIAITVDFKQGFLQFLYLLLPHCHIAVYSPLMHCIAYTARWCLASKKFVVLILFDPNMAFCC